MKVFVQLSQKHPNIPCEVYILDYDPGRGNSALNSFRLQLTY